MDGGKLIAVTQEKDPKEIFAVGDKVHILNGGGVTRVTKL
jgi:outer membrane lipoprotein SlyB